MLGPLLGIDNGIDFCAGQGGISRSFLYAILLEKGGDLMTKRYFIIIRNKIHMPWVPSDLDLQRMDCFFRSPIISFDEDTNIFDMLDTFVERFGIPDSFRYPEVELCCVD